MKKKESDKLEEVYDQNAAIVFRFIYSRCDNYEDAKDILSETFLTYSEIYHKYDNKSKLSTFLCGIASKKLLQYWDKNKKYLCYTLDEEFLTKKETENDKTNKQQSQVEKLLKNILDQLPDKYRSILELRFLKGYSIKETAQTMGLTETNVTTIQCRALDKANKIYLNLEGKQNER